MNKLGRDPQEDATYKIWKLYAFQFQRKRIMKFSFFVPMFKLWPQGRYQFWSQGHHMNILGRGLQGDATYQISNLSLRLPVSEKRNLKMGFFVPMGRGQFLPQGHHMNKFGRVHKEMLYTKHQSSRPSSFREELWILPSLFLCSNLWPPGRGLFWLQGHHMNKLGRGPQGEAIYQISKLLAFQFQRRIILEFSSFVSMFQIVTS